MGKIDELINRLAHTKIQTVPLWSVTAWDKKFNAVDKAMQKKIVRYKYLLAKDLEKLVVPNGTIRILYTTKDVAYTTEKLASGYISEGEVVAIPWGGNPTVKYYNGKFVTGDNRIVTALDKTTLDNKYLFYWMDGETKTLASFYRGAGIKHPSMVSVLTMEIPLPPLAVQKKIVEILDTFTGMISNLQKELEQRQKQFEYYCENLVGSAKGEVKTLGEIGRMERGTGLQKSDFRDTGVPCIHYGQIHTYYNTVATETKSFCSEELAKKLRKAKPGDLLIATTSEDVEACCKATVWLGEGEVAYSGDSFKFSHNQNPKYIAYLFKTEAFSKQKRLCATGAKVVRVSGAAMEKFKFSFPSLETQQEIVDKLDTFEALISNIKQEIELRQKQYEYYREKLLTFE